MRAAMNIKIIMPVPVFRAFLGRCVLTSREYAILRNSVIDHIPDAAPNDWIEILCDRVNASILLDHARRVFPAAAPFIENPMNDYSVQGHQPALQYRRLVRGDTWHFVSTCSQWPALGEFMERHDPPRGDELCNECIVKSQQKRNS